MIEPKFDIDDPKHRRRLVRRVIAGESPEGELVDAIFTLASGGRVDWSLTDWQDLLDDLDKCDSTVGEWLDARRAS